MAVIPDTLALIWAGSVGSHDRQGGPIYQAAKRVRVDNPLDQSQTVIPWYRTQEELGTPYSYGNDTAGSIATLKNIRADRMLETTDWWIITLTYEMEGDDESRPDDEGNPTLDPLAERAKFQCSSQTVTRPANNLIYIDGYNPALTADIGTKARLPCNSALVPFDPVPERDAFSWWYSVEKNVLAVDGRKSFIGYINSNKHKIEVQFATRGGNIDYRLENIEARQSKIHNMECELSRRNSQDFLRVRYFVEVLLDETFEHLLVDRGLMSRGKEGDPDGRGSTIGDPGQGLTPILPARPPAITLKDPGGVPISEPVLFDGDGKPIPMVAEPFAEIISRWVEGKKPGSTEVKETDFSAIPVLDLVVKNEPAPP